MTEFIWLIGQAKTAGGGSFWIQLAPLGIIFVLFYFLIISPQRKREKEHQSLLNALKKGDRVMTSSGMFGEVFAVTRDTVVVEVAPKVKITFQRSAITALASPSGQAASSPSSSSSSSSKSLKKKKK